MSETRSAIAIGIYNLHKTFPMRQTKVLDGVTFEIPEGGVTFLLGPSGTGKSVLIKHIVGLLRPDQGEIRIFGTPLPHQTGALNEMRKQFGLLFQEAALFDSLNVFRNVAFPLMAHRRDISADELRAKVCEKLRAVGIAPEEMAEKFPNELSGGMRKRVGLARALILDPKIMLYDEPTTGLDPITRSTVERLIMSSNRQFRMTSVVITHDLSAALGMANQIIFLYQGKLAFSGPAAKLRESTHPIVVDFLRTEQRHAQGGWSR